MALAGIASEIDRALESTLSLARLELCLFGELSQPPRCVESYDLAFAMGTISGKRKYILLMNSKFLLCLLATFTLTLSAWAAPQGSYQVTGPVLELTDTKIVVQKGDEKWELARTPDTKVTGALKVGSKVTISYTMTAKAITVK